MHRSWLLALVLAACGGGSKSAATTTAPAKPAEHPCVKAVGHMLDIAISAEAKDAPPEKRKALEDEVVGHCEHDNWSDAMQTCMLDAKTTDDLAACDQFMTADQHAALAKEQADGGGAGSAVAPHAEKPKPTLTPAPASTVMPQDTKRSPAPKNKKGGDPCEGGE